MELTNFFKVMVPGGFHHKLNLPPAVSKELENQKSRRVTLESRLGSWKISLCKDCVNGLICFNQGWAEFVDRHALSVGDFLVFQHQHQAQLRFKVYVFDPTACDKEEFPDLPEKMNKKKKKKEANETTPINPTTHPTNSTKEKQMPYFVKTMVPTSAMSRARIGIPTEFMRSNNLEFRTSVTLRDPRGREWKMKVGEKDRRMKNGFPLRMYGRGWHDFYVSNGLKIGDECVFQLQRPLLTPTSLFFDVTISSPASSSFLPH